VQTGCSATVCYNYPAAELLFEALDQFDQESSGSTAIAEDTPIISRSDEVALFDTLLARSIEHRLAPTHSSDSAYTRQQIYFRYPRITSPGGERRVRIVTPTLTDYAGPGSCKTLQLPMHLLLHSTNPNHNATFEGACIDTGAPRSVVGLLQTEAYARYLNIELALGKSCPVRFRFGK
jgi:hypothetical protein